jgi:hypothetical protein
MTTDVAQRAGRSDADWEAAEARASVFRRLLATRDARERSHLAARALRLEPGELQAMMHVQMQRAQGFGPSVSVLQLCLHCQADYRVTTRSPVAIRAWFEFWQIERGGCGRPFPPAGGPRLDRVNPAREEPLWFESLRKAARIGARKLADFARRPFGTGWSPVIILHLLSMRFDAVAFADGRPRGDVAQRRLAELFVPGLAERWRANLIPEPWTRERPVRLVTARTILFAGMATALGGREAALALLQSAASHVPHRDFDPLVFDLATKAAYA